MSSNKFLIDFAKGHPNPKLLPMAAMKDIFGSMMMTMTNITTTSDTAAATKTTEPEYQSDDPEIALQYGEDEGDPAFLKQLELFIQRQTRHDETSPISTNKNYNSHNNQNNKLFITHGVSHGIDLLCATHTEPGQTVMVEVPTYFLVARIFQSHRLNVQALPMKYYNHGNHDTNGNDNTATNNSSNNNTTVDVDRLEVLLSEGGPLFSSPPKVIYIIPTHQNPTAQTMPQQDRIKLAKICQNHNILLIADEVYHMLDWSHSSSSSNNNNVKTPSRFSALNGITYQHNNTTSNTTTNSNTQTISCCVSVSSFTKIFCPGVRCGWIEAPGRVIERLLQHGYIQSQGGGAPLVGQIMKTALQSGHTDSVLQQLRHDYQNRSNALCDALLRIDDDRIHKSSRVEITTRPTGGYFVWIKLPSGIDANDFNTFCVQQKQIRILPGCECTHKQQRPSTESTSTSEQLDSYARLCFAFLSMDDIKLGAKRLLRCLDEYTETYKKDTSASS